MSKTVFILSKNPIFSRDIEEQLKPLGYQAESHVSVETLLKAPGIDTATAIFIDKMKGSAHAEKWVAELRVHFPRMSLIVLMTESENHLLKSYLNAGISDHLQKPVHPDLLRLRLQLHQSRQQQSTKEDPLTLTSEDHSDIKHVS